MKSQTAALRSRPGSIVLLTALVLATAISVWTPDEAHACRPDMDIGSTECGTP